MTLAAALLLGGSAHAQSSSNPFSFLGNIFTGSISKNSHSATASVEPTAPVAGGSQGWSGQDGASGDPLMTAAAIEQAAANFNNCVAGMWPDAARRNISQENFQRFTAGLTPDLHIMDLLDAQPEFTKSIWDYLDILVNDNRLATGRQILAQYKPQFDMEERVYGVDRHVIAAIWGIDRTIPPRSATVACCNPPRRSPVSAADSLTSGKNFSRRWKS